MDEGPLECIGFVRDIVVVDFHAADLQGFDFIADRGVGHIADGVRVGHDLGDHRAGAC